jgi:hypothetical protein
MTGFFWRCGPIFDGNFSKSAGKTPGSPITTFGDDDRNSSLVRHSGMFFSRNPENHKYPFATSFEEVTFDDFVQIIHKPQRPQR